MIKNQNNAVVGDDEEEVSVIIDNVHNFFQKYRCNYKWNKNRR